MGICGLSGAQRLSDAYRRRSVLGLRRVLREPRRVVVVSAHARYTHSVRPHRVPLRRGGKPVESPQHPIHGRRSWATAHRRSDANVRRARRKTPKATAMALGRTMKRANDRHAAQCHRRMRGRAPVCEEEEPGEEGDGGRDDPGSRGLRGIAVQRLAIAGRVATRAVRTPVRSGCMRSRRHTGTCSNDSTALLRLPC